MVHVSEILFAQALGKWGTELQILGSVIVIIFLLVFLAVVLQFAGLWIQSKFTGAGIGLLDLVTLRLQKVNPNIIVRSRVMAVQAGLSRVYEISHKGMAAHYLAGGNVMNVTRALIAAHRAKIPLDWQTAAAIDLAGRDILDAMRTSVYPKVIDCPDPSRTTGSLDAVAGDGIQLKARARVTVRTNINQLVGGATEDTIIARVGQGIVQAIGSTPSYKDVLENPDSISQTVLDQGLESQTAFEIVSIDIADIDVGDNIGARLMADQAEADMRVAQANAEQKRAEAFAREHEQIASIQESRAKVVLAEAKVPQAIAESFRSKKLGLMDYLQLKNVQADTQMRSAIAGEPHSSQPVSEIL